MFFAANEVPEGKTARLFRGRIIIRRQPTELMTPRVTAINASGGTVDPPLVLYRLRRSHRVAANRRTKAHAVPDSSQEPGAA
ncbi:hypothetical protein PUNSTDRAFT_120526 [Punctularia strigosozonata HHB-11173 SS5]|uniref:uncharacterized protein n=1 Tax=Punctularia strigosozonata (strain HHB-11173) TaxID=741275 RepID=UPI0004416ADA|nr:uncharacterized protein PUNSTDRAFT_120526 [Punctularia strigosozonata HHB-11173 SS5]EIN09088.1 hypothetical protein PUNSTDRAFT_120526 [Punctularia strigosozonata HHB-11173 SS5]